MWDSSARIPTGLVLVTCYRCFYLHAPQIDTDQSTTGQVGSSCFQGNVPWKLASTARKLKDRCDENYITWRESLLESLFDSNIIELAVERIDYRDID